MTYPAAPDPVVDRVAEFLQATYPDADDSEWTRWIKAHNLTTLVRKLDRDAR